MNSYMHNVHTCAIYYIKKTTITIYLFKLPSRNSCKSIVRRSIRSIHPIAILGNQKCQSKGRYADMDEGDLNYNFF